jgi:predicted phage terminase large subunit-like protein
MSRQLTTADLDLMQAGMAEQARRSFWAYRQFIHPNIKKGWWQKDAAHHLQMFYNDMIDGKRPRLLIQAPPQHGKSMMAVDFISWVIGKHPDTRAIYASFSSRLGTRANLQLQRILDAEPFKLTFPDVRLPDRTDSKQRNTEVVEIMGGEGVFRNTTVRGSITGEGLDLGVIDDPIKGHEEAKSPLIRDKTWDWLTDDFMTRFSDHAALLGIMTRWHLDDPFGRLIEQDPSIKVLIYPAIAEHDDEYRKEGEALFPEHKPIDFLLERKALMASTNFAALYQQSPTVSGGNLFKEEWWQFWTVQPTTQWRMIYADTASKTKTQNDYSVFQCWGKTTSGQAVFIDQIRGKWESPELRTQAKAFWAKHNALTEPSTGALRGMRVEDKSSGTGLIQELRRDGMPITGIQRSIDKVERGNDTSPFVESRNVLLPSEAHWLSDFLTEATAFPAGKHDDQIDPMMDAIKDILANTTNQVRVRQL